MNSRYIQNKIATQTMSNDDFAELISAVLCTGTPFRFQACGTSMDPFIKDGDVITIAPSEGNHIRFGDIVAFRDPRNDKLAVHRVVGHQLDRYLIKGDTNTQPDGWIGKDQILGNVTRIERLHQSVSIGLGFERRIIAFLSFHNILTGTIRAFWSILRPFLKGIN